MSNALTIIEVLGGKGEMGVSDLARKLKLAKSTCHRLLTTLEARDFVRQNPETGKYQLGIKTIIAAGRYLEQLDIAAVSKPILENLSQKTGETVHIAIREGNNAIFINKAESIHAFKMISFIGWQPPLLYGGGKSLVSIWR